MSWQDRSFHHHDEGISFPFVQAVHQPGQFAPRPQTGGFFQPAAEAEVAGGAIPGTLATFYPNGSEGEEGIFAPALAIAVLKTRQVIVKGRGDGARVIEEWEEGAHSKVQAACLVRGEDATVGRAIGPLTLTVKSTVARAFWKALKAHRGHVRSATGGQAPAYAFYFTFGATQTTATEEGGTVTAFALIEDGPFDPDAAYVGDEALGGIDWQRLDAWAAAWGNGDGHRRGNGHRRNNGRYGHDGAGDADASDERPQPRDPDGPASQAQWGLIRKLLAEIGIEGDEAQDDALCKAGFSPDGLTVSQASEAINRLLAKKGGQQ